MLMDDQRRAVMGWLEVVKGRKEQTKKVNVQLGRDGTGPLHPAVNEVLAHLKELFGQLILLDQDCFTHKQGRQDFLQLIPDKTIMSSLREQWTADPEHSSRDKWSNFKCEIKQETKDNNARKMQLVRAMEDILQFMYPWLDAEVSKHWNHLLKVPFCVHPGTGWVCKCQTMETCIR